MVAARYAGDSASPLRHHARLVPRPLLSPVSTWRGGYAEASRLLRDFTENKLHGYGTQRNKPEVDHTSRLSPYLHFGHISPITVALAVAKSGAPKADREAFLNQILTCREPSVNLVRFNPDY